MTDQTSNTDVVDDQSTNGASPAPEGDNAKGDGADGKSNEVMIPKARLDKELADKRELKAKLAAYEAAEQKAKDERAKAEGDITTAQQERDSYKAKAAKWEDFASKRLEELTAKLGDEEKDILDALPDDVDLSVKLAQAEKLAGRKKPDPSVGSKGATPGKTAVDKIPAEIQTPAQFNEWVKTLERSGDPEDLMILTSPKEWAKVKDEAKRRNLTG